MEEQEKIHLFVRWVLFFFCITFSLPSVCLLLGLSLALLPAPSSLHILLPITLIPGVMSLLRHCKSPHIWTSDIHTVNGAGQICYFTVEQDVVCSHVNMHKVINKQTDANLFSCFCGSRLHLCLSLTPSYTNKTYACVKTRRFAAEGSDMDIIYRENTSDGGTLVRKAKCSSYSLYIQENETRF